MTVTVSGNPDTCINSAEAFVLVLDECFSNLILKLIKEHFEFEMQNASFKLKKTMMTTKTLSFNRFNSCSRTLL
jgi:hypothetical protein